MNPFKNDILVGTAGTAITFGLSAVNLALGCTAGVLTVCILVLKLRREWRRRNN